MNNISAFIGHSFANQDEAVVRIFIDYFNTIKEMGIGFTWDHAEPAEPKTLSEKVREKMRNKNVFIGICTAKEYVIVKLGSGLAITHYSTLLTLNQSKK
jgi:hypothetical protein